MFYINKTSVTLSVNRGLWGEISERLRAVHVKFNGNVIDLYFTFFDGYDSDDIESLSETATSVAADFPECKVFEYYTKDESAKLVVDKDSYLVFLRRTDIK